MSKEDVDLIPEITYDPTTDSETSAARHHIYTKFSAARHQLSPSTLSPLLLTKAAAATEATIELSSSAENAKKAPCAVPTTRQGRKLKSFPIVTVYTL